MEFSYKRYRPLVHVFFWLIVLSLYTLLFGSENSDYKGAFQFVIMLLPITVTTTYFLNYYLVPRYILKKKYILFVLYLVYTFIISITLGLNVVLLTFVVVADFDVNNMVPASFNIIYLVAANYLVVLFAVTIKLINQWYKMDHKNLLLEKKNMETELKLKEAELKLLKAQIHPHFLFNTLNNLYGLVLAGSEHAPQIVLKLSSLLDYTLYQSAKPFVYLSDEIAYVRDYIELEKLRYDQLKVSITEVGEVARQHIAPMVLQPFVENAFKHGVSRNPEDQWLEISIRVVDDTLNFIVRNPRSDGDFQDDTGFTEGIGLRNIRKRLNIIYPGRHNLHIDEKTDAFLIDLTLELDHES